MEESETKKPEIKKTIIDCTNGRKLDSVTVSSGVEPKEIFDALGLKKPESLIILSGGADRLTDEKVIEIQRLLSLGVVNVAIECGSFIFDGGTKSGIMEIMGKGVAHYGHKTPLIGFAPEGKVVLPDKELPKGDTGSCAIDENHSHIVFVKGKEWGDEIGTMYKAAEYIAKGISTVTLLINGGNNAKKEILQSVRLGFPVIVIQGSGRLADEIASLVEEKSQKINDIELAEIVDKGKVVIFSIDGDYKDLVMMVRGYLAKDRLLEHAWKNFACFDMNANRFQRNFKLAQNWILIMTVLITFAVVAKSFFFSYTGLGNSIIESSLQYLIILVPIVASSLILITTKFGIENKWIILRANAEILRAEIYRYRTRTCEYRDHNGRKALLEYKIRSTIEEVISKTEVNTAGLNAYDGQLPPGMDFASGKDDGFNTLTAEEYVDVRLGDQFNYYQNKTIRLERCLKVWQIGILVIGGVGTFLAAIGFDIWIALTTVIAGSIALYLSHQQIEATLAIYNQTVSRLNNIIGWWKCLSLKDQRRNVNFDKLVRNTESVLNGELASWVQEKQDALVDLRKQQGKDNDIDEPKS